jgi:S1-C subfamily serine protease
MEIAEARRLQPFFVRSFFEKAFQGVGGAMYPRESGRFEITHVPALIRERDRQITGRNRRELAPVLKCYERVCFTQEAVRPLDDRSLLFPAPGPDTSVATVRFADLKGRFTRLRVEDASGAASWATGTVVDCRQGEALILTCGHVFRDSQGKGRIEVDLFGSQGPRGVAGQVISWDLKRDLALVSIFTEATIDPVRVGGTDRATPVGAAVVTVGCNGGADPTIHHSRVTAVDKYLGPPNVQVAGQPVQGRSGGGLFAIDGTLIGVCNAADPEDNEGLFAALPSIHEQLEEASLAFVYRNVYPSGGLDELAAAGGAATPHVPMMPSEMPAVSFDRRDRADAVPTASTTGLDEPRPVPAAAPPIRVWQGAW